MESFFGRLTSEYFCLEEIDNIEISKLGYADISTTTTTIVSTPN